ncbi:MAG: class I SAM-dependent methyltransferase [Verrucomicrobiota bacterium]|nr:class I SAM-dependent methyltransferase [Verrucomicrobiota bacterium]
MIREIQCRSCASCSTEEVINLGEQPLANNFLSPEFLELPEQRFPLGLVVCTECWMLQITDLVPPVDLFSQYVYFSSYSEAWVVHAAACAARYREEFSPGHVVEIASNDGYLLRHFADHDISHLGIEPAANIAKIARTKGVETRVDFFSEKLARDLVSEHSADLILANNVFAHVPDTNDFVAGLKVLLSADGYAVMEFPYAVEMIGQGEFDTIYHEHVFYFTLTSLEPLMARHQMRITRVERTPMHGGSLRIFVRHDSHRADETVTSLREEEVRLGVGSTAFYQDFASKAEATRSQVHDQFREFKAKGQRVAAYGAAAKGSTFLNFCGLTVEDIEFVVDRSPHKQGKLMPGTLIPILSCEELGNRAPEVTLLLAWNFADEILGQQAGYREAGGKFLIPIPEVRLA